MDAWMDTASHLTTCARVTHVESVPSLHVEIWAVSSLLLHSRWYDFNLFCTRTTAGKDMKTGLHNTATVPVTSLLQKFAIVSCVAETQESDYTHKDSLTWLSICFVYLLVLLSLY